MRFGHIFLRSYGFVYEGVMFIPYEDWPVLYESEWNEIKTTIEGML